LAAFDLQSVQSPGRRWTQVGRDEIEDLFVAYAPRVSDEDNCKRQVVAARVEEVISRLLDIFKRDIQPQRTAEIEALRFSPVEGMAECLDAEGLGWGAPQSALKLGDLAYVREIPNMEGHCLVLRSGELPLVGYHLDRFRMLTRDET
jgi:hypothetical protein